MITVVLPYWTDPQTAWRNTYTYNPEYVYRSIDMIERHLTVAHEFVILTDNLNLFPGYRKVKIDQSLYVPGKRFQKLMIFHPKARELFGERIFLTDLDNVFTGNIDGIVRRPEDIVLWKSPGPGRTEYNTSLVLLRAGARTKVWDAFTPKVAIDLINKQRLSGTDQAFVSWHLKNEAVWTKSDGVYSYRYDYLKQNRTHIPEARIVSFHGRYSPALPEIQSKYDWVRENYYGSQEESKEQTG